MLKIISDAVVAVFVFTGMFAFLNAVIWYGFTFPSTLGFFGTFMPALIALKGIPFVAVLIQMLIWVMTFEMCMFGTRIVFWVLDFIHLSNGATNSPVK